MNIAYFLDTPVGLGGAGNLLLNQAALMAKIYNVWVIIPCNDEGVVNPEYAKRCKKQSIRFQGMNYSTSYDFTGLSIEDLMYRAQTISDFINSNSINLVHSVQLNPQMRLFGGQGTPVAIPSK